MDDFDSAFWERRAMGGWATAVVSGAQFGAIAASFSWNALGLAAAGVGATVAAFVVFLWRVLAWSFRRADADAFAPYCDGAACGLCVAVLAVGMHLRDGTAAAAFVPIAMYATLLFLGASCVGVVWGVGAARIFLAPFGYGCLSFSVPLGIWLGVDMLMDGLVWDGIWTLLLGWVPISFFIVMGALFPLAMGGQFGPSSDIGVLVWHRVQTTVNERDLSEMVLIPAGEFTMGSHAAADDERPQHRVYLPDYYIARYPVTVWQYRAFCEATTRRMPPEPSWGWLADHPVVNVSWQDAVAYCEWAGGRLPSEAEWEKAARGTDVREYPWGNDAPTAERCNSCLTAKHPTDVAGHPKGASPYRCLGMAGNVWEWCSSLYRPYRYDTSDGRENSTTEGHRVLRGGSWFSSHFFCRCASRSHIDPVVAHADFGFRVVLAHSERPFRQLRGPLHHARGLYARWRVSGRRARSHAGDR